MPGHGKWTTTLSLVHIKAAFAQANLPQNQRKLTLTMHCPAIIVALVAIVSPVWALKRCADMQPSAELLEHNKKLQTMGKAVETKRLSIIVLQVLKLTS